MPAEHATHALARLPPVPPLYEPPGQRVHADMPAEAVYEPVPHAVQAPLVVTPVLGWYFPATHPTQARLDCAPTVVEKVPVPHATQPALAVKPVPVL